MEDSKIIIDWVEDNKNVIVKKSYSRFWIIFNYVFVFVSGLFLGLIVAFLIMK